MILKIPFYTLTSSKLEHNIKKKKLINYVFIISYTKHHRIRLYITIVDGLKVTHHGMHLIFKLPGLTFLLKLFSFSLTY